MTVDPNAGYNNYADEVIQEVNLPEETAQGTADDLHDTSTINIQQLRSVVGPDNGNDRTITPEMHYGNWNIFQLFISHLYLSHHYFQNIKLLLWSIISDIMQRISLLTYKDTQCILKAISQSNELKRKEILKKGLKNVIEITSRGKCKPWK